MTHLGRRTCAELLHDADVPKEYIDQHGGWVSSTRENVYNDACLPLPALRVLAGFDAKKGAYYIARDILHPDDGLLDSVFPSFIQTRNSFEQRPHKDKAGLLFIKCLRFLSKVLHLMYCT